MKRRDACRDNQPAARVGADGEGRQPEDLYPVIDLVRLGTVESLVARNAQPQRVASTRQRACAGQERVSDPTAPAVEPIREDGDPHPGTTSALS